MKPTTPLLAPPPGVDVNALDLFTAEGAPPPAAPRAARIARPVLFGAPRRYRMPLWRFFGQPK